VGEIIRVVSPGDSIKMLDRGRTRKKNSNWGKKKGGKNVGEPQRTVGDEAGGGLESVTKPKHVRGSKDPMWASPEK